MSTVERPLTILRFPNVRLTENEGHYLKGYIANQFGHMSTLLHNHIDTDGGFRHNYPLVQYKVIRGTGTIIGIHEGADLVSRIGSEIRELDLDGRIIPVHEVDLQQSLATFGVSSELSYYKFLTYWLALKQERYRSYRQTAVEKRSEFLERILTGNILSVFSGVDFRVEERIEVCLSSFETQQVNFRNEPLIGFECMFYSNAIIPDYIGLGKATARGFGVISKSSNINNAFSSPGKDQIARRYATRGRAMRNRKGR